jgi:hypothetical protein
MTNLTSRLHTSPEFRELAISTLERKLVSSEEKLLRLKKEPADFRRDERLRTMRIREALKWARRQARGKYASLLPGLLWNFAVFFVMFFGLDLLIAWWNSAAERPEVWSIVRGAVIRAFIVGPTLAVIDWRRGRQACSELLDPVSSP